MYNKENLHADTNNTTSIKEETFNLLNTQNILGVYRATGNANDDGYLSEAQFQSIIAAQIDEASFREYYALRMNNPFNYSLPRTIRLGVKLDF